MRRFMQEVQAHANGSWCKLAPSHNAFVVHHEMCSLSKSKSRSQDHSLCLGIVAGIASTMATDLAPPDRDKWTRVAVGAAPCQDVAIGGLHDGKDMSGALVGHGWKSILR